MCALRAACTTDAYRAEGSCPSVRLPLFRKNVFKPVVAKNMGLEAAAAWKSALQMCGDRTMIARSSEPAQIPPHRYRDRRILERRRVDSNVNTIDSRKHTGHADCPDQPPESVILLPELDEVGKVVVETRAKAVVWEVLFAAAVHPGFVARHKVPITE